MKKGEGSLNTCLLIPVFTFFLILCVEYLIGLYSVLFYKKEIQNLLYDCLTKMEIQSFQILKTDIDQIPLDTNDFLMLAKESINKKQLPVTITHLDDSENGRIQVECKVQYNFSFIGKDYQLFIPLKLSVFCERINQND